MGSKRVWPLLALSTFVTFSLSACVFGGSIPTPTSSQTPGVTASPTPTATKQPRPSATPTPTPSSTPAPAEPDAQPRAEAGAGGSGGSGANGATNSGGASGSGGNTPTPPITPAPPPAPNPDPPTIPAACPTSETSPGIPASAFGSIAEYSTVALAQGESCTGFRSYLSTGLPQYDSQSYEFFGHLIDDDGNVNAIALMSQGNAAIPGLQLPFLTIEESGLIFNRLQTGDGPIIGGIDGAANVSVPVTIGYEPWNIHVEQTPNGKPTQTIDMQVVSGSIGAVGAVYELTADIPTGASTTGPSEPTTLHVRAKDTTGMIQWGYGPNGFFPLWMFDGKPLAAADGSIPTNDQRTPIMNQFGGDIGAYLNATGDPMTGQGSHYYSMPLVQVEQWSMTRGTSYIASGTGGQLFFDNLTETYNPSAKYLLTHEYHWTEFSVQLPDTLQGMLIATTSQSDVGKLNYAMLGGAGSSQSANGTLVPSSNWPQQAIDITPISSSAWTSPTSCYVYDLGYHVQLDASSTRPAADLVFTATASNQELNVLGRSAYEGLFNYTGTLDGKPVSGYSWGEIQGVPPAGHVTPPSC